VTEGTSHRLRWLFSATTDVKPHPSCHVIKAKFNYASWFEAGRRQVRSQFPLLYLVGSWFEVSCRQVQSWSATSFEPALNELWTS